MKQAKRPAIGLLNQGISKNDPRIAHLSKPPTDKPTSAPTTDKQYSKGEASEERPAHRLTTTPQGGTMELTKEEEALLSKSPLEFGIYAYLCLYPNTSKRELAGLTKYSPSKCYTLIKKYKPAKEEGKEQTD